MKISELKENDKVIIYEYKVGHLWTLNKEDFIDDLKDGEFKNRKNRLKFYLYDERKFNRKRVSHKKLFEIIADSVGLNAEDKKKFVSVCRKHEYIGEKVYDSISMINELNDCLMIYTTNYFKDFVEIELD